MVEGATGERWLHTGRIMACWSTKPIDVTKLNPFVRHLRRRRPVVPIHPKGVEMLTEALCGPQSTE